jgi:hypothetical protein
MRKRDECRQSRRVATENARRMRHNRAAAGIVEEPLMWRPADNFAVTCETGH